jgi:hypothetical protein
VRIWLLGRALLMPYTVRLLGALACGERRAVRRVLGLQAWPQGEGERRYPEGWVLRVSPQRSGPIVYTLLADRLTAWQDRPGRPASSPTEICSWWVARAAAQQSQVEGPTIGGSHDDRPDIAVPGPGRPERAASDRNCWRVVARRSGN